MTHSCSTTAMQKPSIATTDLTLLTLCSSIYWISF